MSYFQPSAPPMPNPPPPSSSSSNPSNYNYNYDHNYNNYDTHNHQSLNYPPPAAQSYHVGHQSYSSSTNYGQTHNPFPPGTDPEIIRNFEMVDRDRSGYIEDYELQNWLSSGYHRFNLRTIRLLMFLFKNPSQSALKIGPSEFAALWKCIGEWRSIFQQFGKDRSGKIDAEELRDALYSLGYAVPPSVLQLLISHHDDGRRKVQLDFDSFVECGMVIKGLTEKFKEKDSQYTGSATISYDDFMTMVLPFLVMYN